MKKFAIIICLFCFFNSTTPTSYGVVEYQQNIITTVPSAVSTEAIQPISEGIIEPQSGNITISNAGFKIYTNSDDANYDYILTSTLKTNDGESNAYSLNNGGEYLLFGNITELPDISAVTDVKTNNLVLNSNKNVIAYPIQNILTNLLSAEFINSGGTDYYYKVSVGDNQKGQIIQSVGSAPLTSTYSVDTDMAGIYQTVLTLTINRKL